MPADIFGRGDAIFGGAMSADATRVTFEGTEATGLILQQVRVNYSQNVTRLYGLEDGAVYFVAGRTEGQLGAQQIIGPRAVQTEFYTRYGNVCEIGGNLTLQALAGCSAPGEDGGQLILTVSNPVLTSVSLEVSAREMIISNGLQMLFVALDISDGSAPAT